MKLYDKLIKYKIVDDNDSNIKNNAIEKFINDINNKKDKPVIFLFASYEFGLDFITQNIKFLSKFFHIYKVFTNAISEDENNKYFDNLFSIKRDFKVLEKILKESNINISIIANIGSYYHWYVPFFKEHTSSKLVVIEKDFSTMLHCPNLQLLSKSFDNNELRAVIENECEIFMLEEADGIITVMSDKYTKQFANRNILNYVPFRDKELYEFNDKYYLDEEIELVFCGTLHSHLNNSILESEGKLYNIFESYIKRGFNIKSFVLGDVNELEEYNNLGKKFSLNEALKIDELVPKVKNADFGMMVYNFSHFDNEMLQAFKFIFPTKIFTYLSAGLPILISEEYGEAKDFLLELGVAIEIKLENYDEMENIIRNCDYKSLKNNVKKFQKNYSLENNEKKLINFLNGVYAE